MFQYLPVNFFLLLDFILNFFFFFLKFLVLLLIKGFLPQPKHFHILKETEGFGEYSDWNFVEFIVATEGFGVFVFLVRFVVVTDNEYEDPNEDGQETMNE